MQRVSLNKQKFKMTENTTINIKKQIRKELQGCKKYKRETYDEILQRLIKNDKWRLKK